MFSVIIGAAAWYAGRLQQLPVPPTGGPGAEGPGQQHQPPPPQNGYPSGGPSPQPGHGAGYRGNPQGDARGGWGPNPQGHAGAGYGPNPGGPYAHQQHSYSTPPPQDYSTPPPPRTEPYGAPRSESDSSERPKPRARSYSNASASWQKAKEETRKREEERRRNDELRKRREEEEKKKAEAERQTRATAEKEKWEKMRQREKEIKEREAREASAKERLAKEKEKLEQEAKEKGEKEAKEKAEREARVQAARERLEKDRIERAEKAAAEKAVPTFGIGERTNPYALDNSKAPTPAAVAAATAYAASSAPPVERKPPYVRPTAQSYVGTATDESYRPYDKPRPNHAGSGSSFYSSYSESYAPTESTARTSPPPSHRGPYTTNDANKIVILGVHKFSDSFPKPSVSLIAGQDGWSDGIVLTISTEGMQLDDAISGGGMREWDIKAWGMKCVEVSFTQPFIGKRSSCAELTRAI
jgi:hypothetical protein